jgi:hypothetical protein
VNKQKKYTLSEQFIALKRSYPEFNVKLLKDCVICNGLIRPTSRSINYSFKLKYRIGKRPKVNILNPELKRNFKKDKIPHVYSLNELCLYYPKYQEFNSKMLLSDCIIPWTSLWLYHYENWHITGEWKGGGIHPNSNDIRKKAS